MKFKNKTRNFTKAICFCLSLIQIPALFSCSDNDFENTMRPEKDAINISNDTFNLKCQDFELSDIPSKVSDDSLLLGKYTADTIGETQGSILMQFASSGAITLPNEISDDSLYMRLYFDGYNANGTAKLELLVKRMTQTLNYRTSYYNDMDVSSYVGSQIKDTTIALDTSMSYIDIPLNSIKEEFQEKIRNSGSTFESDEEFLKYFPGLYLESGSASTALINVTGASLFYSYTYKNNLGTEIAYSTSFPASKNVRQVNIIKQTPESVDLGDNILVVSPGKKSMSITIPVNDIKKRFGIKAENGIAYIENGKKLAVNSAMLTLSIAKEFSTGYPQYMLLVKKSEYKEFLETTSMPDNVNEILGTYNSSDSTYLFTLKYFIADEMKKDENEDCEFVLIPAEVTMNTAGTVIGVVHDSKLHAVLLKKADVNPTSLSVVVTGW